MGTRYQQFLGSEPGIVVELVDDSTSPYRVRTRDGFEFLISAEDFKNYYRKEGSITPDQWSHFITRADSGLVESKKMAQLMDLVHSFEHLFHDFDKARSFIRDVLTAMESEARLDLNRIRPRLEELGWDSAALTERDLTQLKKLPHDIMALLLGHTCAVIPFIESAAVSDKEKGSQTGRITPTKKKMVSKRTSEGGTVKSKAPRVFAGGMKNVELSVNEEILTVTVDLSKEFGPSKSGKTIIVASSQGNKTVPGRGEKIGLNIYRKPDSRAVKGHRKEFKNAVMQVDGDILTVRVDLSKEQGPSKSGQTMLIASTEGNQPVYGREEKIGLNVYKKIE